MVTETTPSKVLTEADAANYIRMSRSFLRQARMDGHRAGRTPGPRYLKIGRAVRYVISDLDRWLDQFRSSDYS